MRPVVGIFSVLAILFYGTYLFIGYASSGLSDGPPKDVVWLPLLLPFVYYGYCLAVSIFRLKTRVLLITGIFAHLAIVPFCVEAVRKNAGILIAGPIILASCWFAMYMERRKIG